MFHDNDIVLLKNEKYDSSIPLSTLNNPARWVHVRPNILLQGRVVWYDQEKAEREREKERERLEKGQSQDEVDENESDYSEEGEEGEEEQLDTHAEKGPSILTPCSYDINSQTPVAWTGRFTSRFTNKNERMLVMQSNIWPGAFTFVYKDLCESIYLGWGHKIVSRNMAWKHMMPIEEEYIHQIDDFIETNDPSVEMEEAYRLSLLSKELKTTKLDDYDEHGPLESSDDEGDEDDDEDDDEEE